MSTVKLCALNRVGQLFKVYSVDSKLQFTVYSVHYKLQFTVYSVPNTLILEDMAPNEAGTLFSSCGGLWPPPFLAKTLFCSFVVFLPSQFWSSVVSLVTLEQV